MTTDPNDSGILNQVLSDACRKALIEGHMQAGADRQTATEIVDVAFHASRESYRRVVEATAVASIPGAAMVCASQLLALVFEATSKATAQILEAMGAQVSTVSFRLDGED